MKATLILVLLLVSDSVIAGNIATCGPLKGKSYYANVGPFANDDNSGWEDDGISTGKVTVTKDGDEFDVLYVDASGEISSEKSDGGNIFLSQISSENFTLMVVYPGYTIQIYSFWKENDGSQKYSYVQVKGGASAIIKSSLLIGECSFIDFSWVE